MNKPQVAIIGGGCAGLAAAVELAAQGVQVTLFEAAPHLGGRARGLTWQGKRLDNGQHILIGAYRETLRLLQLAGTHPRATLSRLPLKWVQWGKFELEAVAALPAPLHILAGLLRAKGLTWGERLAALAFMAKLKLGGFHIAHDEPLAVFLARHQQPKSLVEWLWQPLCLAALNTPLDQASTRVFLNVLRDSFSQGKSDSDLLLPRHDLSRLLAAPLARFIEARGGEIRLANPILAIHAEPEGVGYRLQTPDGLACFQYVIIAAPPFRLPSLIATLPALQPVVQCVEALQYQPIVTLYLQYPETVALPFPMIGLCGGHAQWVLDRGALDGQRGLLAVVISAEGAHQALTQEALAQIVSQELAHAFPALPAPLWHKVINEKRATFACTPDLPRPEQRTALPGLYLAGDYTAGDYPATIEGAIRSGVQCAHLVVESFPHHESAAN